MPKPRLAIAGLGLVFFALCGCFGCFSCTWLFIIHPTTRRRLRRQRAKARLDWFLYKKGFVQLSKHRLTAILNHLRGHHSKDVKFLEQVGRAIPTMSDYKVSWKCKACKKVAKATAEFCAHCGKHWSGVWDPSFVPAGGYGNYAASSHAQRSPRSPRSQWPEQPARSPSRRRQRHGRNQNAKGEPKGKQKDLGKSGSGGKAPANTPSAPQLQAETSWTPPSIPPTLAAPPTPPLPTTENIQVKNLLSALKKASADLPQEVQTALQKMQSDDSRQLTKQLHSAVSQLGNSKKALADLTSARSNLHQSWSAFLESAIGRWERYAEEFSQQDRDLATQIEKAKETMKICKDHFKSLQALEGATSEPTTEVISDDEENSQTSKVDVHMKQMQESLKILKGGMEEELRGQKRQRLEETTEQVGGVASAGAPQCGQGGK